MELVLIGVDLIYSTKDKYFISLMISITNFTCLTFLPVLEGGAHKVENGNNGSTHRLISKDLL